MTVRRGLAVLFVLVIAAGCAEPVREGEYSAGHPQPVVSKATGFNGTDHAWLQLMIPMDEQALDVLALIPARNPDPATTRLAAQVGAGLRAELAQLVALRTKAGLPSTNVHEGHDLPGLVTAEERRAVEQARGVALGTLVAARLREHFTQSVVLCRGESTSGADQATKALSATIERTRATQLALL